MAWLAAVRRPLRRSWAGSQTPGPIEVGLGVGSRAAPRAGPGVLAGGRVEASVLPMSTLRLLLVIPLLLVAAAFLGISAAIVLRGRPVLLGGRLSFWVIFLVTVPIALAMLVIATSISDLEVTCISILQIGVLALMIVGARRFIRGYMLIGASEETLRDSLQSALARLGLPFEESVVGFTLTSLHETLQTRIEPRLGSAQFHMKSSEHPQVLAQIAQRVAEYLRVDSEPPSMVAPLVFGVAGLVVLALAAFQAQRF